MGKTSRWLRNGLLSLLVIPTTVDAAPLRVRFDGPNEPTAYYLVPERLLRGIPTTEPAIRQRLASGRWKLPMSAVRNLPPGNYYVFPECPGRGIIVANRKFVGHQAGEVRVRCP